MQFLYRIILGIFIGAGAILPGISSGVLCVIFGIYDKLVDSVLGFFKDCKKNFCFLFPIILGIFIGVVIFGNILKSFFITYPMQTKSAFIGLILGCMPSLIKTANSNKGFRLHYLIYTVISFIVAMLLLLLEKKLSVFYFVYSQNALFLILSGFIMSVGIVVPGVSSTVLLMILGTYDTYLDAVSTVNICVLIPMGIGVAIGGIVFLKFIQYAFKNYFSQTYYTIIGFVLGSIFILYPNFSFDLQGLICMCILVIGFYIGRTIEKKEVHNQK